MGTNTSVGCAAPIWARYTMMLIGISVSPEVFSTRNMIIGLLAVSFLGFSSCNPSMAFRPKGVAALSNPNMLAAKFMKILPVTGCPLGISGKSLVNRGLNTRAKRLMIPPFSPIFMIPNHKESTPVSPKEISKAVGNKKRNIERIKEKYGVLITIKPDNRIDSGKIKVWKE